MAQEPRVKKIAAMVAEALEKEIGLMQCKIVMGQVALESMQGEMKQDSSEVLVAFEERKRKIDEQKRVIPLQIEAQEAALVSLVDKYESHLKGKSVIGKLAGAIDDLDELLGDK